MARAWAPFQLRGKIHNLIFKVQNGKQVAHMAPYERPQLHKQRMLDNMPYRANVLEFAMASTIACEIHRRLAPGHEGLGPVLRPYAQNLLTAKLKQSAERHNKLACAALDIGRAKSKWFGRSIRLPDIAHALSGLDLSREGAPAECVRMIPFGPKHNPTSIRIIGLEKAAKAVQAHGNARLECRIHLQQSAFSERQLTPDGQGHEACKKAGSVNNVEEGYTLNSGWTGHCARPSDWIPAQILPVEGLLLELPLAPADAMFVTVVMVEWREVRTTGRRIVRHHGMAVARIASVHGPAEAYQVQARDPSLPTPPKSEAHSLVPLGILNRTLRHKPRWETDPKAFIQQALARMKDG